MKGFRSSGLLALGIMAALFGPSSVSAQPVINGTFYEENATTTCNNGSGSWCVMQFTQLTARVLFTKVTCQVLNVPAGNTLYSIRVGVRDTAGGTLRRAEGVPLSAPQIVGNGLRYYSVSAPLDFLFAAGKYPTIYGDLDGTGGNASCKLTGRVQP